MQSNELMDRAQSPKSLHKETIRLCKDCRHYQADKTMPTLDICLHPETQHATDLVRGEKQETYCDTQRSGVIGGMCGKGAKYWEAKC